MLQIFHCPPLLLPVLASDAISGFTAVPGYAQLYAQIHVCMHIHLTYLTCAPNNSFHRC